MEIKRDKIAATEEPSASTTTHEPSLNDGTILAHFRKSVPLSLRELSSMTGLSVTTLHDIEAGSRTARASTVRRILTALGPGLGFDTLPWPVLLRVNSLEIVPTFLFNFLAIFCKLNPS